MPSLTFFSGACHSLRGNDRRYIGHTMKGTTGTRGGITWATVRHHCTLPPTEVGRPTSPSNRLHATTAPHPTGGMQQRHGPQPSGTLQKMSRPKLPPHAFLEVALREPHSLPRLVHF